MENSIKKRFVPRNGSQSTKSTISTSEKGPIDVNAALSRLPRKVKSIEKIDIPPDPELEKGKLASERPPSVDSSKKDTNGKARETPKQSSQGINVDEILREEDELSRVSRAGGGHVSKLSSRDGHRKELSKIAPESRIPRLSRSPEGSRVQSRFADILEKSRTFEAPVKKSPEPSQIPVRKPVETSKIRELPFISEQPQRRVLQKAEIIKEKVAESPGNSRNAPSITRDEIEELVRQLQEEKENLEAQKYHLQREKEEFEQIQQQISENLQAKNEELEKKYQEILSKEAHMQDETEKASKRRTLLANDYEFNLKVKDIEKHFGITLPEEPEARLECYQRAVLLRKRLTFRKTARRLFVFVVVVIEFVISELLGIDITDFAEDQVKMLSEYDEPFDQISARWFGSGPGMSPETKICLMFTFNIILFIAGKYATKMGGIAGATVASYGKTFVKDFVSQTFLQVENNSSSTGDVMLDGFFMAAKAGRDFVKGDKTAEQKKPKGPQFTE